ncbi:MAG: hypothetical protein V1728_04230, partial [Candidatus Micrarchaeota archaeon]
AEWNVNPQFFGSLLWVGTGIVVGAAYGIPAFLIRKLFKEIHAQDAPNIENTRAQLLKFLPMILMAFNYIFGVLLQGGLCVVKGISFFNFKGASLLTPHAILPIAAAAFFFVLSWFFNWKLLRMIKYDLSKILIGLSSTAMIAALISLGLNKIFGIGSVPFQSAISWIAPVGVIAGSFFTARETAAAQKPTASLDKPSASSPVTGVSEGRPELDSVLDFFIKVYAAFGFEPFFTDAYMAWYPDKKRHGVLRQFDCLAYLNVSETRSIGRKLEHRLRNFDPERFGEMMFVLSQHNSERDNDILRGQVGRIMAGDKLFSIPQQLFVYGEPAAALKRGDLKFKAWRMSRTFALWRERFDDHWVKVATAHRQIADMDLSSFHDQVNALLKVGLLEGHKSNWQGPVHPRRSSWVHLITLDAEREERVRVALEAHVSHCSEDILRVDVAAIKSGNLQTQPSGDVFKKRVLSLFPAGWRTAATGNVRATMPKILDAIEKSKRKGGRPSLIDIEKRTRIGYRRIAKIAEQIELNFRWLDVWGVRLPEDPGAFTILLNEAIRRLRSGSVIYAKMPLLVSDLADELRIVNHVPLAGQARRKGYDLASKGVFMVSDCSRERIFFTGQYVVSLGLEPSVSNVAFATHKAPRELLKVCANTHKGLREDLMARQAILGVERQWRADLPARRARDRYEAVEQLIDTTVEGFKAAVEMENDKAVRRLRYA